MNSDQPKPDLSGPKSPHFSVDADGEGTDVPAWEEVEAGRFLPRRTRGSCTGRALG